MSDDELIIDLDPIEHSGVPFVPLVPPTPTEIEIDITKPDLADTTFWLFSEENRELLIHAVSDVIVFYLFFKYVTAAYAITSKCIQDTEDQLKLFRRQYGIEKPKRKRTVL